MIFRKKKMNHAQASLPNLYMAGSFFLLALYADKAHADVVISFGSASYWHHAEAINNTADQFLGRPVDGTDDNNRESRDNFSTQIQSNSDVSLHAHGAVALTWRNHRTISPHLDIETRVRFEYGSTRYFLKDGIGPFRDDITVRLAHASITPTIALRREVTYPPIAQRLRIHLKAGAGVDALWARTHITSALLNVKRHEQFMDRLLFVGADVALQKAPNTALTFEVQWRDSIGAALRLGFGHKF